MEPSVLNGGFSSTKTNNNNNNIFSTDNNQWTKNLKNYEINKTSLPWGYNEKPKQVTHQEVKQRELRYHPILQVYNDKQLENSTKAADKKTFISTLANNKDNAMRMEQTFDLITLKDKMSSISKGHTKNESLTKNKYKTNANFAKRDYNILYDNSNSSPSEQKEIPQAKTASTTYYRDFNIISNKYKENDEEKKQVDKTVHLYSAAKLFNDRNIYNPVKGRFYDDEKEKIFQKSREEKAHNKNQKRILGEGDLYNPINMSIVDDQLLLKADKKAQDKKKRFGTRYEVEAHYRSNPQRPKRRKLFSQPTENSDIIKGRFNDGNFYNRQEKNIKSRWDELIQKANNGNSFQSKTIYRSPFDFSDANSREKNFRKERRGILEKLPGINEDKIFTSDKKSEKSVIAGEYESKQHHLIYQPANLKKINQFSTMTRFSTSKQEFFNNNKNIII